MPRVAIIGSGLIGRAWAMVFARAGWNVAMYDAVGGVADKALSLVAEGLDELFAVAAQHPYLDRAGEAHVVLSLERHLHHADITIMSGAWLLRGREKSEDMYASIDQVIDKLERQIRSGKGASVAKKRGATSAGQ